MPGTCVTLTLRVGTSVTLTTFTAVICSFTQTQTGQNRLLPDPCTGRLLV
jgi:hypothetical protein